MAERRMTDSRDVSPSASWTLSVVIPVLLIAVILAADTWEGPKTAFVGVLTAVPLLAAVFGTPLMTAITAGITWFAALDYGLVASDGNVPAQVVRLIIIALAGVVAVLASYVRRRRDLQFQAARRAADEAEFLRVQASHDDLTGLLNRRGLFDRLRAEPMLEGTVMVLDCDDFKQVNDRFGHVVGDEYLRDLAGRLTGGLSREDIIARWGGDEFLVIVRGPYDQGTSVVSRVLAEVMMRPMATSGGVIPVSVSAGCAPLSPSSPLDWSIAAADRAMYAAKATGRGGHVISHGADH